MRFFGDLGFPSVILVNKSLKALCLSSKIVYQHLLYLLSLWTYWQSKFAQGPNLANLHSRKFFFLILLFQKAFFGNCRSGKLSLQTLVPENFLCKLSFHTQPQSLKLTTTPPAVGGPDILGGPKSLETKKLGSSKGWEDQSAEKTNNWKRQKII